MIVDREYEWNVDFILRMTEIWMEYFEAVFIAYVS
jgi:hypothetical protein